MRYRTVGRSGLAVSEVGLGTSNFGIRVERRDAHSIIGAALDLGVTLFDTADVYGGGHCEEILAESLGKRRKDVVIATKWGADAAGLPSDARGGSRSYILKAVEQSLRRLATDYIDLYQMHVPDPRTPIEETLMTLDSLVRQGKARYIGVSNMPAWQIVEAQLIAQQLGVHRFVSFQARYNLLTREIESTTFPATDRYGLGLLPTLPLAEGLLTGKYRQDSPVPEGTRLANLSLMKERSVTEAKWKVLERLRQFAQERGHTLLELAMSWLISRRQVCSIIAGASRTEQLVENVAATGWRLSTEELLAIDELTV
ncbi:MAG: aldo/keto reductase [Gammaproteobacteria bacterium]